MIYSQNNRWISLRGHMFVSYWLHCNFYSLFPGGATVILKYNFYYIAKTDISRMTYEIGIEHCPRCTVLYHLNRPQWLLKIHQSYFNCWTLRLPVLTSYMTRLVYHFFSLAHSCSWRVPLVLSILELFGRNSLSMIFHTVLTKDQFIPSLNGVLRMLCDKNGIHCSAAWEIAFMPSIFY